jgi:hypothetical protein
MYETSKEARSDYVWIQIIVLFKRDSLRISRSVLKKNNSLPARDLVLLLST